MADSWVELVSVRVRHRCHPVAKILASSSTSSVMRPWCDSDLRYCPGHWNAIAYFACLVHWGQSWPLATLEEVRNCDDTTPVIALAVTAVASAAEWTAE